MLFMQSQGMVMEGIITITGIIDADFRGEIGLMMHNVTETAYKVLKENPLAQLVVYKVDRLPVIYHASGPHIPKSGFTGGAWYTPNMVYIISEWI